MPTSVPFAETARHVLGPYHACYHSALELYVSQHKHGAAALPSGVRSVRVLSPSGFVELVLAEGTESVEDALGGTASTELQFSTAARAARGGRLPAVCREVWGRLPPHVRLGVGAFCAAKGRRLSFLASGAPPARFPQGGRPLAQASAEHGELWFSTSVLAWPDEALRGVVAHEIAHLYLVSLRPPPKVPPPWWTAWMEGRVDVCVEAWGFAARQKMLDLARKGKKPKP